MKISATQHEVCEWSYVSGKAYRDPFNELELDVVVADAQGRSLRIPAYWAGGNEWRVRFAPPEAGIYRIASVCTDTANHDLHGRTAVLEASESDGGTLPLLRGSLKVADSGRTFEYADGTPFFWLGDTWWMGLCKRWAWPYDFAQLTADRVAKGFTVIQIVAGLYPDMAGFDERGANEAGFPWEPGYERINPSYFDMADLRIGWLVRSGLVPCIVGAWGYYLLELGVPKMKQHWRNVIARWGCYPVLWCLAGEAAMPFYRSQDKEGDVGRQKAGWTEIGRYVRQIDPFHRLVTIHPTVAGRDQIEDDSILDFEMLQTGHTGWHAVENTVSVTTRAYSRTPHMPVVNAEVAYEGHMQRNGHDVQRMMFWSCIMNGTAGHTYGAGGIWQINEAGRPYGSSPGSPPGSRYEDTPWNEALHLPGSRQLGLAKALLTRYPWWRLRPCPESVEPHWTIEDYLRPYASGIAGELRIVYIPGRCYDWSGPEVRALERDGRYRALYFNPINGDEFDLGIVDVDAEGTWQAPPVPLAQDWVLVIERI